MLLLMLTTRCLMPTMPTWSALTHGSTVSSKKVRSSVLFPSCSAFCSLALTLTEPFKPGRKKLTNKELESQRQVHANTQRELKALVERGRMAITTLRERELLARTSRQIAAEEERAAANKAADEQKHAQQAREQKRLQMVLEHRLFTSISRDKNQLSHSHDPPQADEVSRTAPK